MGPLDGQAAYLACPLLTEEDLAQLRFHVGSMDLAIESGLITKYDDIQREFHNAYTRRCGNARLITLIEPVSYTHLPAVLKSSSMQAS